LGGVLHFEVFLMRNLRLVFGKNGTLTTLVLAAVMPLEASCGADADNGNSATSGVANVGGSGGTGQGVGGTAAAGTAGTSTGGAAGNATGGATGGSTATGGSYAWSTDSSTASVPSDYPYSVTSVPSNQCETGTQYFDAIVPLPPEGTLPSPSALCDSTLAPPLDSGWAARVTLQTSTSDTSKAQGTITIAPELQGVIVGMPSVSVVDLDASLSAPAVSGLVALSGIPGYAFDLTWAAAINFYGFGTPPRMVLETRFTIDCGGSTREVRSLTALYFCSDNGTAAGWASSGDQCIDCASICEMAASPILPREEDESMALSGAVRIRLRVIGQLHGALLILAEHDGGAHEFDYQWSATAGRIVWVDRDVAIWVPPTAANQSELVQLAVSSERAAAVASLRWNTAA
jgi:hypothetical protein